MVMDFEVWDMGAEMLEKFLGYMIYYIQVNDGMEKFNLKVIVQNNKVYYPGP